MFLLSKMAVLLVVLNVKVVMRIGLQLLYFSRACF